MGRVSDGKRTHMKKVHEYWDFVDGVRGVAVLFVLLFHFKVPGWSAGYVGVDVFFVISGFLVTRTNLHSALDGAFSLPHFYFRRMRRLFPELFLLLGVTTGVALFLASPQGLLEVAQSGLAQALFVANYFFWSRVSYFDTSVSAKPLLHCWSLSVEEQFYLLYSLFLRVLPRVRPALRHALLLATTLLSLAAFLLAGRVDPSTAFYTLPTRLWEPLLGCVAGFALHSPHPLVNIFRKWRRVTSLLALFSLVGAVVWHETLREWMCAELITVIPVFSSTLLIFVNAQDTGPTFIGRVLRFGPLRWLGDISYSLYLWHWPMITFFRCFFSFTQPLFPTILLVCSFLLVSVLSDMFVGRRLRRLGVGEFPCWSVLVPLLYLFLSAALVQQGGLPQREAWFTNALNIASINVKHAAMDVGNGGAIPFSYPDYCTKNVEGFEPMPRLPHWIIGSCGACKDRSSKQVLFLGDSHAFTLVEANKRIALRNNNTCVSFITGPSCVPFVNVKYVIQPGKGPNSWQAPCIPLFKEVGRYISSHKHNIHLIILVSKWEAYGGTDSRIILPQWQMDKLGFDKLELKEQWRESFRVMYDSMLNFVAPIPVGVMTQIPSYFAFSGSNALCWTYLSCEGTNFTRPYSMYSHRFTHQLILDSARRGKVHLLDTLDVLCDRHTCSPYYKEEMIYLNYVHVNYKGATLFYPMMDRLLHTILD